MSLSMSEMDTLAINHLTAMATGDLALARSCIHPENVNRMALEEPPACREPGIPGFLATSAWLSLAFDELRFDVMQLISSDDVTAAHVRMSGRQTGPFVVFPPAGDPVAFPATGREMSVRQCHLFTVRDGRHVEHVAVRDDLGMMTQLGHLPPSPRVGLRMLRWHLDGGSRRAVRAAIDAAEAGAHAARAGADLVA